MTIKRRINGKTVKIKLTPSEVREAYLEEELDKYSEDIIEKLDELVENGDVPLKPAQLKKISQKKLKAFALETARQLDNDIGKNDSYFDAFWCSVETVLTERVDWKTTLPKLLETVKTVKGAPDGEEMQKQSEPERYDQ